MPRLYYYVLPFITITATQTSCFLDITHHGYEQYQDIIINNTIVKPATNNHKDCQTRHTIIKQILDKFERPFTLLDLGASQGYYSFKSAWEHKDSVFVMIEGNNPAYPLVGTQLLELCKENTLLTNIILLNKKIERQDLQRLSECEHFDVVLALNVIHWFESEWKDIAKTILNMGDFIIVETPPIENICSPQENQKRHDIISYLKDNNAMIIGSIPRHTSDATTHLYCIEGKRRYVQRRTWIKKEKENNTHYIHSNFKEKKLVKQPDWPPNTTITSDWIPGINLMTFKMYYGSHPQANTLKQEVANLKNQKSNDWMPNNMIVQGNKLKMIDCDDPNHTPNGIGGGRMYSIDLEQKILRWLDISNPSQVENFFWKQIVK